MDIAKELNELRKKDPELGDVLEVVKQIRQVYTDIRKVRGLQREGISLSVNNTAKGTILFRSDSPSQKS